MFSILPLQLASNIFIAETSDDWMKFYGLDKLEAPNRTQTVLALENASISVRPEVIEGLENEIIELKVEKKGKNVYLENPQCARTIVVCESTRDIEPINPGEMCIVTPNGEHPRAFYRAESNVGSGSNSI